MDETNCKVMRRGEYYSVKGTKPSGYEEKIEDYIVVPTHIEDAGNCWHITGYGGRRAPEYAQIWIPKSVTTIRWDYGLHSHHEDFLRFTITIPNWLGDKGVKAYHASKKNPKGTEIADFLMGLEAEVN